MIKDINLSTMPWYRALCAVSLAVLLLARQVGGKPVRGSCGRPGARELADLERKLGGGGSTLHWSFYLIPPVQQHSVVNTPSFDNSHSKARSVFLHGKSGRKCPRKHVTANTVRDVHAVCPVHYVLQHDPDRVPESLVHARCNCDTCRGVRNARCVPVLTYSRVFRRTAECSFELVLEPVPVACTCVPYSLEVEGGREEHTNTEYQGHPKMPS